MKLFFSLSLLFLSILPSSSRAQVSNFSANDVFDLEWVSDPQISPSGTSIAYVRNSFDRMKDLRSRKIWVISADGLNNRPISFGNETSSSPRWSPDGKTMVFVSRGDDGNQIYLRWTDSAQLFKISTLDASPSNLTWSPDGKWIAFTMFVEEPAEQMVTMPKRPKGAEWADSPTIIRNLKFQSDGSGFDKQGVSQIFTIPMEGGIARQITFDKFGFESALSWSRDSKNIFASANKRTDRELEANDSEIYKISVVEKKFSAITNRRGPDTNPQVSPDGKQLAYLGYEDELLGFQTSKLTVMDLERNQPLWSSSVDHGISQVKWSSDGRSLFYAHDFEGNGKISRISEKGPEIIAHNRGGTSIGRPYGGGSFSVSNSGSVAYTHSTPYSPSELALIESGQTEPKLLTSINADLFTFKALGKVEELWVKSSFDQEDIQSWIVYPPDFDSDKTYPLLLEIHGGPFANYGDRFSAEVQLYASAGYVVLYVNPRGSTSYGKDFANLIHHNYPGEDYDDLISAVDGVLEKGFIDKDRLFVTGGSGGGVLTSWIIGKTNRFQAAVVAKPVINWFSFVLTADNPQTYYKYWFPSAPWEDPDHYYKRSPISLVGNVETPTMLLTGEEDRRTPMSETEQYYTALKLRGVPAAMVRIPGAGHGIAARPSQLIAKALHVIHWFDEHDRSK